MLSNRLAFAALGIACIAAAAGGGYLASRQNTVPTPASAAVSEPAAVPQAAPAVAAPSQQPEAVRETEAVVGDGKVPDAKSTNVTPSAPTPAAAPSIAETKSNRTVAAARPAAEPSRNTRPAAATPRVARQNPPALERSWPSSAAQEPQTTQASSPSAAAPVADPISSRVDEQPAAAEPARTPEPVRTFEELVVSADSVIGLQTDTSLTSERAHVEDRVDAHVTRDVRVNNRVAIPAGSKVLGNVTVADPGGKFKERARLGIRFNMLVLADGTRVPISTETIYRDGEAPNSAQKVGGGAVGGAILGAILGGGKGAAIGGIVGAGGGAAVAMAGDRNAATLPAGSPLTVRILSPVTVTVDAK